MPNRSNVEHTARLLDRLAERLGVEVTGLDRLPPGLALIVANHAFGFWDLALAVARIRVATGRRVYALGEHLWWKVPLVRRLARANGIVDGTPETRTRCSRGASSCSFCRAASARR